MMKKRMVLLYSLAFIVSAVWWTGITLLQIYYHGMSMGLHLALLIWTAYILCIPAAHGRIWLASLVGLFSDAKFFPELYCWAAAASINIITMMFVSHIYMQSVPTHLLYRIITIPTYWIILMLGCLGACYRMLFEQKHDAGSRRFHRLMRYLILLSSIFVLFYLTHQELIIMLHAIVTG